MAKVENEFLARENPTLRDFQAKPFLPRRPIPDLGFARVDGARFYSTDFMQQEWQHIWTKTWQIAARVSELPTPGSYYVHELGKESFLFVRGEDQEIRGFYNVCQHRGNRLCQSEQGEMQHFTCPFHGWQWHIDGSLKRVADPQFFRQFDNGVPADALGLTRVRVELWGGWVWFNMNDAATDLKSYLGEAGVHLETYEFDAFQLIDYQTFEWNGNWKHAVDAFNESYHFGELHPAMIEVGEGHDIPIELLGIHSRMLNFNSTVSEVVADRDTITPLRAAIMLGGSELSATDYQGAAKDIHLKLVALRRAKEHNSHIAYHRMNDEQLVHQYHYTFFPNATFTQSPGAAFVFRYRPHADDPNKCYYDFFILVRNPPGSPTPTYEHKVHPHAQLTDYAQAFAGTFHPVFANVLAQDGSNMETMQAGVKSDSFKGMLLSEQELRLRHFHQTIDKFIAGELHANEPI